MPVLREELGEAEPGCLTWWNVNQKLGAPAKQGCRNTHKLKSKLGDHYGVKWEFVDFLGVILHTVTYVYVKRAMIFPRLGQPKVWVVWGQRRRCFCPVGDAVEQQVQPRGLETHLGACSSGVAVCPARAGRIACCARAAPGPGVSCPWNRRHCDPHRRAFSSGTYWTGAGPLGGDHRTAGVGEVLGGR